MSRQELLPYLLVRFRANQRAAKVEEQVPEAIDLLGRAMRAGQPLSAGFKMVADESPEPIATEFRQVFEEQRFGLPFADSLLGLGERIRLSDIRILSTAIMVHRQVGGNLAEILDNIAQLVRVRFKLRRQLRVITAQAGQTFADLAKRSPVGDNEPYSVKHPSDFTIDHHAESAGLPHVCIEVRQDQLESPAGTERWVRLLSRLIDGMIRDPALRRLLDTESTWRRANLR